MATWTFVRSKSFLPTTAGNSNFHSWHVFEMESQPIKLHKMTSWWRALVTSTFCHFNLKSRCHELISRMIPILDIGSIFDCEIHLASHSICYVTEFDRLSKSPYFNYFLLIKMFLMVIQDTMKHFKSILISITRYFAKRYESSPSKILHFSNRWRLHHRWR